MSYFAIERGQKYWEHVVIKDQDGNVRFGDYLDMTYDEMKSREDLDMFVVAMMEASGNDAAGNAVVNLIGDDDVFIWGIIIGPDGDEFRYVLVDWKRDGKNYRYEP
jgi:hypothetical protein